MLRNKKKKSNDSSFFEFIKTIFYAVVIAIIFRSLLFEPYNIPSGSMLPNLLIGDYLFVSKFSYGYSRFSFPFGVVPLPEDRVFGPGLDIAARAECDDERIELLAEQPRIGRAILC